MIVSGISTPIIKQGNDLPALFLDAASAVGIQSLEKTVLIITSKVVSAVQGRKATYSTDEEFSRLVEAESDTVIGYSPQYKMSLSRVDGFVLPNAGIDKSNAENGEAMLLPRDPQGFADGFRTSILQKTSIKNFGVVIADSCVVPFRLGIRGLALSWSGFLGMRDERGKKDLFGNVLKVSQIAVADNLATTAQLFFGQADERVPFVICHDAPVEFTSKQQDFRTAQIDPQEDLYTDFIRYSHSS